MSYDTEERDEEGNSHHQKKQEKAKSQPPGLATAPDFRVGSGPVIFSRWGRRS
jgi:hypothetical protein